MLAWWLWWSAWLWIPLTVLALWLTGRFPLGADRWRRNLLVLVGGAALVCLARAIAVVLLTELHALKLQLQPHFLFNTLNTIFPAAATSMWSSRAPFPR